MTTTTAAPLADAQPQSNDQLAAEETSSDDEYEIVGSERIAPNSSVAPPSGPQAAEARESNVEQGDIEALMALAEFAESAPAALSDNSKKRSRPDTVQELQNKKKTKPVKATPASGTQQQWYNQQHQAAASQSDRWRQQQQQSHQAPSQHPPAPQQHQQQQQQSQDHSQQQQLSSSQQPIRKAPIGATPSTSQQYSTSTQSAPSKPQASVMPAHNRCSRHVAIAYFIYYQQRAAILKQQGSRGAQIIMDPTLEARRLKEKSEWLKRNQAAIGPDAGLPPPGSQYMLAYGQHPFAQQPFAAQHAYQMSVMPPASQGQHYIPAYTAPPFYQQGQPGPSQQIAGQYMPAGAFASQFVPEMGMYNSAQAFASHSQPQQMMNAGQGMPMSHLHHLQQQQQQGVMGAMPPGTAGPSGAVPDQLHLQAQYQQQMALAQARYSQSMHAAQLSQQAQAARQGLDNVRQAPLHSAAPSMQPNRGHPMPQIQPSPSPSAVQIGQQQQASATAAPVQNAGAPSGEKRASASSSNNNLAQQPRALSNGSPSPEKAAGSPSSDPK